MGGDVAVGEASPAVLAGVAAGVASPAVGGVPGRPFAGDVAVRSGFTGRCQGGVPGRPCW